MRHLAALPITASLALASTLLTPVPAWSSASVPAGASAPKACPPETVYTVKKKSRVDYWVPGTHFVDGKGGTIQGRVEKSYTKSASLSAGAEASVGAVWASVKAQVSKDITKSNTVTVGHWYSHKINKKKYGHIRYRVIGYKALIYKQREKPNCKMEVLDTFYGYFPTDREGWKYWETSKP